MNITAVIQARMGSTRLPGKVIKQILGKPMILYIVERLYKVKKITNVIVATSEEKANDALRDICQKNNVLFFSGSEEDVLDRFYKAAKKIEPDIVLRVTGDCPLVDPQLIDKLIDDFFEGKYDYYSIATGAGAANDTFDGHRYPDGLDAEIFHFRILETAWKEAKEKLEREHVTPYIWQNPKKFKTGNLKSEVDYSNMRWTVDNQEDFDLIQKIYAEFYKTKPEFGMNDILEFFKKNPDFLKYNKHFIGNEGYEKFWNKG